MHIYGRMLNDSVEARIYAYPISTKWNFLVASGKAQIGIVIYLASAGAR